MSKRVISMNEAILRVADLTNLTMRMEHIKLQAADPEDIDQRSLYQVAIYLEEES